MNLKNRTLRKAVRLLVRGQLTRCIQLLEPKISLFLDNADYFYLLGRSYFTVGDTENAKLYLKRGLNSDPNHEEIQLLQACFAVRERDTYRAISVWLRLENAGCRRACLRYGLDQIRRINDLEELYNFTRGPRFVRLFPALPGAYSYRLLRKLSLLLGLSALVFASWFAYNVGTPHLRQVYHEWRQEREQADKISLSDLNNSEYFSFEKKNYQFYFSESELNKLITSIRNNYDLYNDNLVQRDLNKVFLSNASNQVKAKLRLVEGMLGRQQEIYKLKHNFKFQEVRQNPQLYQNCYVRWQGKPTNIQVAQDGRIRFTLLVGYTDGTVLEGQVPVLLEELIGIPTDQPLTVFGRIRIVDLAAQDHAQTTALAAGKEDSGLSQQEGETAEEGSPSSATFYIEAKTLARS